MLFIVADTSECTELEATDIRQALALGMLFFKQDLTYGNVIAIRKPCSETERAEDERKLTISSGEFFESFGYPDYETDVLLAYIRQMKVE